LRIGAPAAKWFCNCDPEQDLATAGKHRCANSHGHGEIKTDVLTVSEASRGKRIAYTKYVDGSDDDWPKNSALRCINAPFDGYRNACDIGTPKNSLVKWKVFGLLKAKGTSLRSKSAVSSCGSMAGSRSTFIRTAGSVLHLRHRTAPLKAWWTY
jgi:hypothetical protein